MSNESTSTVLALERAQAAFDAASKPSTSEIATQPWTTELVKFLAISVLLFSVVVLITAAILLWRTKANAMQILRVVGIISILGFSSLLLVVGYDNQQLTPIVGLFGAISGYLLGRESSPQDTSQLVRKDP